MVRILRKRTPELIPATYRSHRQRSGLVAVAVQSRADGGFDCLVENRRTAKISFTLLAHPGSQVAGARLPVQRLSRRRQAKTLLRTFVGFHFGHCTVPVTDYGLIGSSSVYAFFGDSAR